VAVSTREVFQAFSRGARPIHAEAAQEVSERLAADMASGLRGVALLERAAELASSNDLLHATVAVVPTLLPFRRALARLLALPVGQSGSGPTCWTLYPSLTAARKAARVVEEALLAGMLPEIGHGLPFVAATTILTGPVAGSADRDTNAADKTASAAADKTASAADDDTSAAKEAVEPGRDAGGTIQGHRVPRGRHNVDVSESVEHDGR
jgi:hypothetical protein